MFEILSDFEIHSAAEIREKVWGEYSSVNIAWVTISALRKRMASLEMPFEVVAYPRVGFQLQKIDPS